MTTLPDALIIFINPNNKAPESQDIGDVRAKEGEYLRFDLSKFFTDPDGDDLTFFSNCSFRQVKSKHEKRCMIRFAKTSSFVYLVTCFVFFRTKLPTIDPFPQLKKQKLEK